MPPPSQTLYVQLPWGHRRGRGTRELRPRTELEELTLAASGWATHEKDGFTRLRRFTDECLKYICDLPLLRSLCLESADLQGVAYISVSRR